MKNLSTLWIIMIFFMLVCGCIEQNFNNNESNQDSSDDNSDNDENFDHPIIENMRIKK